jgi:hypothetical protein
LEDKAMTFWIHKFGRNADVDGAEDVWDAGSNYLFPTVAFQTEIVGIANDIPSSDGVHSVRIEGLDINHIEITEVATLNGATPVVLTNSYYRVNRAFVRAVGSTLINSGNISISHTGSAELSRISFFNDTATTEIYTMPAGVSGHVVDWHCNAGRIGAKIDVECELRFQTRVESEGWRTRGVLEMEDGFDYVRKYESPNAIIVDPKTDIRMRVAAVNTDNVAISGGYEIEAFRDQR